MTRKLALDHDSTLAATAAVGFDLMCGPGHCYSYDDIETWDWGLERFGPHRYLSALWHAWTLRPLEVPPMEDGLAETVNLLRRQFEVHIVTTVPDHPGLAEGKQQWLDYHDIVYDDLVVVEPGLSKADMDYDVYVDDKPALPKKVNQERPDATVFLRDQPYNQDAAGDYVRVQSVADILDSPVVVTEDPLVEEA